MRSFKLFHMWPFGLVIETCPPVISQACCRHARNLPHVCALCLAAASEAVVAETAAIREVTLEQGLVAPSLQDLRKQFRPPFISSPHSSSSSACTKGFSISSLPSTGDISTSSVPLATSSPSDRVLVLPSSSAVR